MGLSTGYMGQQVRAEPQPRYWGAAIFGGGITALAVVVYAMLAGGSLASARTLGAAAVAITLALVAHYLVAKLRALREAQA
jgi:hypothetical protein